MQHQKSIRHRIFLGILTLGLFAGLSPQAIRAAIQWTAEADMEATTHLGPIEGEENWEATQAAQVRSALGECPPGFECLELCVSGAPTGQFQCWYITE